MASYRLFGRRMSEYNKKIKKSKDSKNPRTVLG